MACAYSHMEVGNLPVLLGGAQLIERLGRRQRSILLCLATLRTWVGSGYIWLKTSTTLRAASPHSGWAGGSAARHTRPWQRVIAKTGSVTQRPHDDAGVVLVALHHAGHAVNGRPISSSLRRLDCPASADHQHQFSLPRSCKAVGFQIALVNDVDAILIAQIVPAEGHWE